MQQLFYKGTSEKRIAILFHENDKKAKAKICYCVFRWHLAWGGEWGYFLFGVKKFVPADLIIVHVDLSVVPDEYSNLLSSTQSSLMARQRT